jgi:O-antigen/teichoic acid export membrane protein
MNNKFSLKQIATNFAIVQSRTFVMVFVGLLTSVVLARALGAEGRGQLAVIMLLPVMLSIFLNLGVSSANVFYISSKRVSSTVALRTSIFLTLFLSLLGVSISVPLLLFKSDTLFPGAPLWILLFGMALFPIQLLDGFFVSIINGQQRFKEYAAISLLSPFLYLAALSVFVWMLDSGVIGAVASQLVVSLVSMTVLFFFFRKFFGQRCSKGEIVHYSKRCFNYGGRAHLSNIMAFVNYRADLFILNLFLSSANLGIYAISVALAESLWLLSKGISTVLLPKLSELHNAEGKRKMLTPFIARWVFLLTFVAAVVAAIIIPYAINLFYGAEFMPGVQTFRILLIGIVLGSFSRVLANDIAARDLPQYNFYASIAVVSVNVTMNFILIPKWGIIGAATATSFAYGFNSILKICIYSAVSRNRWTELFLFNDFDKKLLAFGARKARSFLCTY